MFKEIKNKIEDLMWQRVERIKEKYEAEFFFRNGVQAVGKGYKIVNHKITNKKAILVFVLEKLPETLLSKEEIIPKKVGGVFGLFGCETDVICSERIEETSLHRERHRPIQGGISTGHATLVSAGTLGMVVFLNGKPCILSNAHVLSPHWVGAKIKDPVIQPGRADGGRVEKDTIGFVEKYIEIETLPSRNLVDASLSSIENTDYLQKQLNLSDINTKIVRCKPGDIVKKSSRTSGIGEGRVLATDVIAKIWFTWNKNEREVIWFKDQVFLSQTPAFVRGGDSGSVVFTEQGNPCGLIFAGSPQVGVANQMDNVHRLLGFKLELPTDNKTEIIKIIEKILELLKKLLEIIKGRQ